MLQKETDYSFALSPYSRQHGFSASAIINAFQLVCVMSWAILLLYISR